MSSFTLNTPLVCFNTERLHIRMPLMLFCVLRCTSEHSYTPHTHSLHLIMHTSHLLHLVHTHYTHSHSLHLIHKHIQTNIQTYTHTYRLPVRIFTQYTPEYTHDKSFNVQFINLWNTITYGGYYNSCFIICFCYE
jgi:hypothetical protein